MVRKGMMIKATDAQPEMAGCAMVDAPRAIGAGMSGGAMPEMSAIIGMGKDGRKYYIDPAAFTTHARAPVPRTTQLTGMAKPLLGMTQKMPMEGEAMTGGFLGALLSTALPLIGSLFGRGMMNKEAKMALTKHFKMKPKKGEGLTGGFLGSLLSAAIPLIGSLFGKGMMTKEAHDELVKMCKSGEGRVSGGALGVDGNVGRPMRGSNRTYGVDREVNEIVNQKEDKQLTGGSFWGGFMDSYADAMGEGRVAGGAMCGCESDSVEGGAKKRGRPAKVKPVKADGRKARAEIVKKVMRDRGIKSLAEASKIVKAEGLY
jgi:hypothetical protein